MSLIKIVRTRMELRSVVSDWRAAGTTVALTPTMGALHEGHLSLVRLARSLADRSVVSLFVNPTQFGQNEDFEAYPRNELQDANLLEAAGCDLLYAPAAEEIYPPGFSTSIEVSGVSKPMEGAKRPTHFAGVATIVSKLLIQCQPDFATFGEKDYQQLQLIRRLVRDLDIPSTVVGGPIIRDADGLALSSRNAYLTKAERSVAPALYRTLRSAAEALGRGETVSAVESHSIHELRTAGFDAVDYFDVRDPEDLRPCGPGRITGPARIITAAQVGRTRLLDNVAV